MKAYKDSLPYRIKKMIDTIQKKMQGNTAGYSYLKKVFPQDDIISTDNEDSFQEPLEQSPYQLTMQQKKLI